MLYGLLASMFFALTFLLNRSMNLGGGYWLWSASLRYLFMLPMLWLLLGRKGAVRPILRQIRIRPVPWLVWSTVGFGLFYAPLSLSQLIGVHGQHGCGAGHRAAPGQQVHDTHACSRQAQQDLRVDIHFFVHGVHRGDGDQHRGGGGAVQMGDGCDQRGCHRDGDDIAASQLDQLLNNDIKHTGVAHNTEIDDEKDEQDAVACGGTDAAFKAAPHNSARSLRQDFCPNSKFGKRRNTVCISRFSN